MAQTKEERLSAVHEKALASFDRIQAALRDERLQCLQDRRFLVIAGAQWEGPLSTQFENKPRFEANKCMRAHIHINSEYRNNKMDAEFISKDGKNQDQLADACAMMYRADKLDSGGEEVNRNAVSEGSAGGMGAIRLRACYEDESDEENEKQRIKWEAIYDADSCVFFDLDAKAQDKHDAKECFVLNGWTYEAYEEEYDDDPTTWPKEVHQNEFDWTTPSIVYVAEYYKVEEISDVIHIYRGLNEEEKRVSDKELKEDEALADTLRATGFREIRQKKVKKKRVHKYIMSGAGVLEDCSYIAGENIPIIPYYGNYWVIDNIERCMGHVRLSKDSQRLKNMQLSKLAEISATSSVQKPIVFPEQMSGHQRMWARDNIENFPALFLNQILDASGNPIPMQLQYTQSPQIPPAMAALLQITDQDMKDIQGNFQDAEELQPNTSGRAVELVQQRVDMPSFVYIDNAAIMEKRCGEVWLSMAKEIYVEEDRYMKGITEQGEIESLQLQKSVMDESGALQKENDLSNANFDVRVKVGPSSSSRRQATVRALTSMIAITPDPETQQVLGAMTMMNMEGEGIEEVRDYYRQKLVRMGVIKPTEEEMQQMQAEAANQQPDPNALFLQASAEEAQAQAAKARADTVLTIAKSKETEAKTLETISNIDMKKSDQVLKAVDLMHQHARDEMSSNVDA